MKILSRLLILLFLTSPVYASYYGSVETGAAHLKKENRYIINPVTLTTFDPGWQTDSKDYPVLFFNFNFKPSDFAKVYIGIPFASDPRGILKYTRYFGDQSVSLAGFHYIRKPLFDSDNAIEVDHDDTDRKRYGGILTYGIKQFKLSYEGERIDMDGDDIGAMFPDLKRSGDKHQLFSGFEIDVLSGLKFKSKLGYIISQINGKSNAYRAWDLEIGLKKIHDNYIVGLTTSYNKRKYRKAFPLIGKVRTQKESQVTGSVTWLKPFEVKPLFVTVGLDYERVDSNIQFYDEKSLTSFLTVGIRFKR